MSYLSELLAMERAERNAVYNAKRRERRRTDPAYAARVREREKAKTKKRVHDPAFKARKNAARRSRYANDPEYRSKELEKKRSKLPKKKYCPWCPCGAARKSGKRCNNCARRLAPRGVCHCGKQTLPLSTMCSKCAYWRYREGFVANARRCYRRKVARRRVAELLTAVKKITS